MAELIVTGHGGCIIDAARLLAGGTVEEASELSTQTTHKWPPPDRLGSVCHNQCCGRRFRVDDDAARYHREQRQELPKRCTQCRRVAESRVCIEVNCGQAFNVTMGDMNYYAEMEYPPPRRCYSCRAARKLAR